MKRRSPVFSGAASFDGKSKKAKATQLHLEGVEGVSPDGNFNIAVITGSTLVDIEAQRIAMLDISLNDARLNDGPFEGGHVTEVFLSGVLDIPSRTVKNGSVKITRATLPLPDFYDRPVDIANALIALDGISDIDGTRIILKSAGAHINGLKAQVKGSFALRANGSVLGRAQASIGSFPLSKLGTYWPKGVAPGGKRWVVHNVKGGLGEGITVTAQFDQAHPEKDALDLQFAFRDGSLTFVPGMPPLQSVKGKGDSDLGPP